MNNKKYNKLVATYGEHTEITPDGLIPASKKAIKTMDSAMRHLRNIHIENEGKTMQQTTKKKPRKDNYKNRNYPKKSSWPFKPFMVKMIDGKRVELQEKFRSPKGSVCGRCGQYKDWKTNKCMKRTTWGTMPKALEETAEKSGVDKNHKGYFCLLNGKAYI